MKVHYNKFPYDSSNDPYFEEQPLKYTCGSPMPEFNINETASIKLVTCKKCLKNIEKILKENK